MGWLWAQGGPAHLGWMRKVVRLLELVSRMSAAPWQGVLSVMTLGGGHRALGLSSGSPDVEDLRADRPGDGMEWMRSAMRPGLSVARAIHRVD